MNHAVQLKLQSFANPRQARQTRNISQNYNTIYKNISDDIKLKFSAAYGGSNRHPSRLEEFQLDSVFVSQALRSMPPALLDREVPTVIMMHIHGDGSLTPHIDYHVTCGINYYYDMDGDDQQLLFYQYKNPNLFDHRDPSFFLPENLEIIETYQPAKNQFWMINNQQPHNVRMGSSSQRWVISYDFNRLSYTQVLKIFQREGLVY